MKKTGMRFVVTILGCQYNQCSQAIDEADGLLQDSILQPTPVPHRRAPHSYG